MAIPTGFVKWVFLILPKEHPYGIYKLKYSYLINDFHLATK